MNVIDVGDHLEQQGLMPYHLEYWQPHYQEVQDDDGHELAGYLVSGEEDGDTGGEETGGNGTNQAAAIELLSSDDEGNQVESNNSNNSVFLSPSASFHSFTVLDISTTVAACSLLILLIERPSLRPNDSFRESQVNSGFSDS